MSLIIQLVSFLQPMIDRELIIKNNSNYSISQQGTQFLAETWPITELTHQKILQDFSRDEIEQLQGLLDRVQQNCLQQQKTMIKKDKKWLRKKIS